MWFSYLPQSYGSLSDNFFVIHASLYYKAPSGSCFVSKFFILSAVSSIDIYEFMQELHQKDNFTGTTIICIRAEFLKIFRGYNIFSGVSLF